ncbi:MAG: urate hydroxylase PuuD, partial [Candidatus Eisenbacteria bacterium]
MHIPPLVLEWLGALARLVHVIAAIMWIGDSFLFMWMDSSLEKPSKPREGDVQGELWMVHSGGFYEVVKRRSLKPEEMPRNLYWFMWQSYSTWLSGAFLLVVVYWFGDRALLVDSGSRLSHLQAVLVSLGTLVAGWLVYDGACRSPLAKQPRVLTLLLAAALVAAVFGLTHVFGARAAWLLTGAMLGTVMVANVAEVIVPGQRKMLAQTRAGVPVDTGPGKLAKYRSTHNHYLTLPVLFMMLSQHFPSGYGHPQSWLVLTLVCTFAIVLKYVMNLRTRSDWRLVTLGVAALLGAIVLTARPGDGRAAAGSAAAFAVPDEQALAIVP